HNLPAGGSTVPLVSTDTNQPAPSNSPSSSVSSCNKGSPPVQTTNGGTGAPGQCAATAAKRSAAVRDFVPPTKSVSHQREQPPGPFSRSRSRPVHRLHPAKRKNTAGRPACAPSPCKV